MRALRGEPTKPIVELKTSKSTTKSTAKAKSTERVRRDRCSDATVSLINADETMPSKRLRRVCLGGEKCRVTRAGVADAWMSPACLGGVGVTARRPSACWSEQLAWRWAAQLVAAGWVERVPMTRGEGSLLFATSAGVEMAGGEVQPSRPPAPTWWAHLVACAWTAAWFTSRGRPIQAPREVDLDERWCGQIRWRDGHGEHEVGHRPDLAWVPDGA